MWFYDSVELITCKSIKILILKIWPQNNPFSTITWVKESKNRRLKKPNFYPIPYIVQIMIFLTLAWFVLWHLFSRKGDFLIFFIKWVGVLQNFQILNPLNGITILLQHEKLENGGLYIDLQYFYFMLHHQNKDLIISSRVLLIQTKNRKILPRRHQKLS